MAIQYVGCTEGRGISPTTEIGGGVGGTLKVVANASLNIAYKKTQQEDSPVAFQIVKDCMDIARTTSPPDDPERSIAASYEQQFAQALKDFQTGIVEHTPTVQISTSSASPGDHVTVRGSQYWSNEMVHVYVGANLVAEVKADANGAFSTTITVPSLGLITDLDALLTASGQSSAESAEAPLHIRS